MTVIESPLAPSAILYDLLRKAHDSYERDTRSEMRYSFCRLVSIRAGEVNYPGLSREISQSGIGLLHPEELPLEEVTICFRSELADVSVRAQIQWCKPLGDGWFISGGPFTGMQDM